MATFEMNGKQPEIKIKEIPEVLVNRNILFVEYKELCETMDELEKKKDSLKAAILETLAEAKCDSYPSEHGTFSRCVRKSYIYSDNVKLKAEELTFMKKEEEESGKAKAKETIYLMVK